MKPARIIILAVAISAAGLAGILAMKLAGGQTKVVEQAQAIIKKEPTVNVLVSAMNLPVGSRLNADSIRWMAWPEGSVVEGVITEQNRPNALTELGGAVVRLPMFEGEPVRAEKIADANSRIMSSLLPSGKRAVATDISVSTGAGGFILPNDRVDIVRIVRDEQGGDTYTSETILKNMRVLAIGQNIQEKNGEKVVVGSNATLEVSQAQAEKLILAQRVGQLSLVLCSMFDANKADDESENRDEGGLTIVRFGVPSTVSKK